MPSGGKPKQYPDEIVSQVKRLYESGITQHEVAAVMGLTQKVIFNVMRRHNIKARKAAKRNQSGSNNHMWKGKTASYTALHFRVETELGKPLHCDMCGTSSTATRYEWANVTGDYFNVADYRRMCVKCHRNYDAQRRKETGKPTSSRTKKAA